MARHARSRARESRESPALPGAARVEPRKERHGVAVTPRRWWPSRQSPFWPAAASALLMWAAFPPLGFSWLAWIAPAGLLALVRRAELLGKRPYLAIWLAGFLHWLVLLQGMRLAHWATHFGWAALACYLAFYWPAFVAIARMGVHRLRLPLVLVGPVVWTGLELACAHLLTGFSMATFGHTQAEHPLVIQVADLGGAYAVSFMLLLVGAAIASIMPLASPGNVWPALPAAVALGAALSYGQWRLGQPSETAGPGARIALLQESNDTSFDADRDRLIRYFLNYRDRMLRVRESHDHLDLVVWPEGAFSGVVGEILLEAEPDQIQPPPGAEISKEQFRELLQHLVQDAAEKRNVLAREARQRREGEEPDTTQLLVGVGVERYGPGVVRRHNAAVLVSGEGDIVDQYYKMHPVLFGEYIPLGDWLPWLYRLTPVSSGLDRGTEPRCLVVGGVRISPSICFESTVPHLIRGQTRQLAARGSPPDVLVNLTDDGWFWGSSILDLHFRCAVFRAIENRRPFLVAANTGLSAWIDAHGRIVERGPRRAGGQIVATVHATNRASPYARHGDAPAGICLAATIFLALVPLPRALARLGLGWRRK